MMAYLGSALVVGFENNVCEGTKALAPWARDGTVALVPLILEAELAIMVVAERVDDGNDSDVLVAESTVIRGVPVALIICGGEAGVMMK
jgi:hypothetical protein